MYKKNNFNTNSLFDIFNFLRKPEYKSRSGESKSRN